MTGPLGQIAPTVKGPEDRVKGWNCCLCCRYYAIVHPLSAMKFNSKSRTKKILAATWAIPVVLASPYTFSKSYPFVITSHMGSISRQICNNR